MKKKLVILSWLVTLLLAGCVDEKSGFASGHKEDSPEWVLGTFFTLINEGKYEESLNLFKNNPVGPSKMQMQEYTEYINYISKDKTIISVDLSHVPAEDMENAVEVTSVIWYKDGTGVSKWVIVETVDGKWQLTTRGSLF